MYDQYFIANMKNENVLKSLFRYLKDFEISPLLINTKTAFMIYYFTSLSQSKPEETQVDLPPLKSQSTYKGPPVNRF